MIIEIPQDAEIPLLGLLHIGIIDRGSNLLQLRPTTVCNLNCPFCSTCGGINSQHKTDFIVDSDYIISWLREAIKLKDNQVSEINIDSVGEPLTHPDLIDVIEKINKMPEIKFISMQTNGTLLTKEKIKDLESAGLDRINLSIHSLDKEKSKYLSGSASYNISHIIKTAKEIAKSNIELTITPVWLPDVNDKDIEKLIKFSKELDCKIAIQKYEEYKYSRKLKSAKRINWFKFYKQLTKWEKDFSIKLKFGPNDYNIKRTKRVPLVFEKGDKMKARIISKGWMKDEMIAQAKNRAITILNCKKNVGDLVTIKIIETRNSIYLARQI